MEITDEQLQQFKNGMHIMHKSEDDYLKRILGEAASYVMGVANVPDITSDAALELVFNRARYAYNDNLGDFDADYGSLLLSLSINQLCEEVESDGDSE